MPESAPSETETTDVSSSPLIRALRGKSVEQMPVWFMRQAGSHFDEHRELYEEHGVRGITQDPKKNCFVSTLPVKKLNVDGAVMYADIILPLEDMGIEFHYGEGETGPIIHNPISTPDDVRSLKLLDPQRGVPYILEAISRVREELSSDIPIIGFSGGLFTLAGYMIEGEASRKFPRTKQFMHDHPDAFRNLMEKLSESIQRYFKAQIEAGAGVIQLFDSWLGALSPETFRRFLLEPTREIYDTLEGEKPPTIFFATGVTGMLEDIETIPYDALGLDWRISLEEAGNILEQNRPIQGNLEPELLFAPERKLEDRMKEIVKQGRRFPGHVFNLGHRIPLGVDADRLKKVVDLVHSA
ncbi:MAG: uroporphyrinogen decarboxylase [bacterium]